MNHTTIYFPCEMSYWPGFTNEEVARGVRLVKLVTKALPGIEICWVTKPDQFVGVRCGKDSQKAAIGFYKTMCDKFRLEAKRTEAPPQ